MQQITDFLFYIMGGVPLMNTFWILPWILFFTVVMVWPVMMPMPRTWRQSWIMPAFIVCFFGGMIMAVVPPLAQVQGMSECRTFETEVSSDLSAPTTIALRECRSKSNVYHDLGPWTIQQGRT